MPISYDQSALDVVFVVVVVVVLVAVVGDSLSAFFDWQSLVPSVLAPSPSTPEADSRLIACPLKGSHPSEHEDVGSGSVFCSKNFSFPPYDVHIKSSVSQTAPLLPLLLLSNHLLVHRFELVVLGGQGRCP